MISFFMSLFKKPLRPLSDNEYKQIVISLNNYKRQSIEAQVQLSFAKTIQEINYWSLKRLMIANRVTSLNVKLLQGCECGGDHKNDIQTEKELREMYLERILSYEHKPL